MKKIILALMTLLVPVLPRATRAQAEKEPYPVMAPFDRYMMTDESAEIALARSAAPASISSAAEVMVLRKGGFVSVVPGTNGFICIVERSWANPTGDPQFWNPKVRAPHCFNPPAAKTALPLFLMKTRLVLAGKSRTEIAAAFASAQERHQLPALAPGTLVYMMSKQQYINDSVANFHPHVMFYAAGDAEKSLGANLPDSPVTSGYDSEQRLTTYFVLADKWSDGTPASPMSH